MVQERELSAKHVVKLPTLPSINGPREILMRAMTMMVSESEVDRRIAYILIDASVELMMRTYLELPGHLTDVQIGRARLNQISESFMGLLDALDEHGGEKLRGLDPGEIEYHHRRRSRLYHEGNGLDIDYEHLEAYLVLAQLLFQRLFNEDLVIKEPMGPSPLRAFIALWADIDLSMREASANLDDDAPVPLTATQLIRALARVGLATGTVIAEFDELRSLRHRAVHGEVGLIKPQTLERLEKLRADLVKTV